MKNCKIAICDQEVDFAFGLMNYINSQPDNPCMAMAFTNQDNLIQYLNSNQVELLIAGDNLPLQIPEDLSTLWLTDGQDVVHEDSFYKYQSVDEIIPVILEHIDTQVNFHVKHADSNTRIYAVYSPIGRCGKTNIALAMCHYSQSQSLYLGFEEYSSFMEDNTSSEEFLYYVKQKDKNILSRLHHLTSQNNSCSMIHSPSSYLDLRQINYEELQWLLEQLKSTGYYKQVVFDIGAGSLWNYQILELFDTIYLPILQNSIAEIKKTHFYNLLQKSNLNHIKNKIKEIQVPKESHEHENMETFVSHMLEGEI